MDVELFGVFFKLIVSFFVVAGLIISIANTIEGAKKRSKLEEQLSECRKRLAEMEEENGRTPTRPNNKET